MHLKTADLGSCVKKNENYDFTNNFHNLILCIQFIQTLQHFAQQIQKYRIAAHLSGDIVIVDQFLYLLQIIRCRFPIGSKENGYSIG